MAALTICDLPMHRALDKQTMSAVKGGDAGWVFGWIRPYVDASAQRGFAGVVNVYQTNYINIADQINNQISAIDIHNSAANAVINVDSNQQALNAKQR